MPALSIPAGRRPAEGCWGVGGETDVQGEEENLGSKQNLHMSKSSLNAMVTLEDGQPQGSLSSAQHGPFHTG